MRGHENLPKHECLIPFLLEYEMYLELDRAVRFASSFFVGWENGAVEGPFFSLRWFRIIGEYWSSQQVYKSPAYQLLRHKPTTESIRLNEHWNVLGHVIDKAAWEFHLVNRLKPPRRGRKERHYEIDCVL